MHAAYVSFRVQHLTVAIPSISSALQHAVLQAIPASFHFPGALLSSRNTYARQASTASDSIKADLDAAQSPLQLPEKRCSLRSSLWPSLCWQGPSNQGLKTRELRSRSHSLLLDVRVLAKEKRKAGCPYPRDEDREQAVQTNGVRQSGGVVTGTMGGGRR